MQVRRQIDDAINQCRDLNAGEPSRTVDVRLYVLVPQAGIDCQIGADAPSILEIVSLSGRAQLPKSRRDGVSHSGHITKEEIRQIRSTRVCVWVPRVLPVEFHRWIEKLAAVVVVPVAADVGAHAERVFAADERDVVHPLERSILVRVWIRTAAPCARSPEICHGRDTPGRRHGRWDVRDVQLAQHISLKRQLPNVGIMDHVRPKAEFVDDRR